MDMTVTPPTRLSGRHPINPDELGEPGFAERKRAVGLGRFWTPLLVLAVTGGLASGQTVCGRLVPSA